MSHSSIIYHIGGSTFYSLRRGLGRERGLEENPPWMKDPRSACEPESKLLKGGGIGNSMGRIIRLIKGDTESLDHGSCRGSSLLFCVQSLQFLCGF